MGRYYKLSNGTLGPFPEGRIAAARASSRVYTDLKGCKNCKSITFITASGRCVSCMRDQIAAVYMFISIPEGDKSYRPAFNLPENFEPIKEAHEAVKLLKSDEGFKLGKEVCSDYGHIKLTNDKYHRCYFCETQGNKQEQYLFVSLFRACAESLASENASRLAAMQRADSNIDQLLNEFRITFHRVRQAEIDEELFDVIAGFEALPGNKDQ